MSMTFRAIDSVEPVAEYVTAALSAHLAMGKRVLWLVSGGSAAAVAVAAGKLLRASRLPLGTLTVTLVDERYGDVGHAHSNWKQLEEMGFDVPGAVMRPVLQGKDMAATTADFESFLQTALADAGFRLGLFGIGADGHTSGILPHSGAVPETSLAYGYDGDTFQRVTTTPAAIARLDEAVVYAVGEAKWPVLDQLETDITPDEQPAQVLKQVPKLTIFNDHKGERL